MQSLLREAATWLRAQGATQVVGPMDGDTWHRYRVNVGPFDAPPFLLEPFNPTYYASLWSPFEVIERYSSKRVDDIAPLLEKLAPMHARAAQRGYRVQFFEPCRSFAGRSSTLVWRLSLDDLSKAIRFYFDIGLDDFLKLYDRHRAIARAGSHALFIARTMNEVGFLFAYPDSEAHMVDYKTIGVLPAHRRGYLGWALLHQAYASALELGRPVANHCLMHESNASQSMDAGHGTTFREYYLYTL